MPIIKRVGSDANPIDMAIFKSGTFMAVLAGIILLMAVVIPITGAMGQLSEKPVHSENALETGDYMMTYKNALPASGTIVISDTEDGVTMKVGSAAAQAIPETRIIITDTCLLTILSGSAVTVYESDGSFHNVITTADGDSITFSRSTWTIKHTPEGGSQQTVRGTFSWIYYPDDDGEYLHANAPVYVDSGEEIVAGGATYNGSGRTLLRGTLADMDVVYSFYGNASVTEVSYEKQDRTNVLNSISVVAGGTSTTLTDFIVPLEYTSGAEASVASSLVFLVPVLLAAALIIGIVYRFVIDRREA